MAIVSTLKYFSTRKSFFFMFVGLFVLALYLYFFVGVSQILTVLRGVNPEQYILFYLLAFLCIVLGNFLWSAGWRASLRTLGVNVSVKNAFLYYWTGYFVDLVVPCENVCGEVTRLLSCLFGNQGKLWVDCCGWNNYSHFRFYYCSWRFVH